MNLGKETAERIKRHIKAAIPSKEEPLGRRIVIWAALTILALVVAGLFIMTITVGFLSLTLPNVRDFNQLAGVESTLIFDRDGGILHTIYGEENRKYVGLSEIEPKLQEATVAIEDFQFFEHPGFDVSGLVKAVLHEFLGLGNPRGGSTITQQLAKNAFLTRQHSYTRKLKELILAVRLERSYDKDKILELYLNRIPYGHNAYGAELASKMYFGKSANSLSLAESAVLASIPKAPTYYSPHGPHLYSKLEKQFDASSKNLPSSIQDIEESDYTIGLIGRRIAFSNTQSIYIPGRTDIVLRRMQDVGYITEEEKKAALSELQKMEFKKYRASVSLGAHFVFEIREELEERFGKELVAQGGLRVYTTLDRKLQQKAEEIIESRSKSNKDNFGATTAALYSINAKTGEVLAMVGSADYYDTEARGNVNHVFARRHPGSSFKPIVYAKAFLNRYSPATVIYDTPTNFGGGYIPQNYEGGFKGPLRIRQALGQSRNIPAIKTYFMAGQQQEIIPFANKLGIESLKPSGDYGPALALGAAGIQLAEMVEGFSVFANNGIKREPFSIYKIVDRNGEVVYERKPQEAKEEEVLDPQVAYLINDVLSDKSVYLGPRLDVPGHITAVKTGTSNKEITPVKILPGDLWTLGYTPSIVTGVWVGNSLGGAMKANADGYNVAAPIWSEFMKEALKDTAKEDFPKPEGIKNVLVTKASGKLPTKDTPEDGKISEVFASFAVPTEFDDIYSIVEVNELDNMLPNEYTPKEYIKKKVFMNHHDPIATYPSWLAGIKSWIKDKPEIPGFPPTEKTKMFTAETSAKQPTLQITSPSAFTTIRGEERFTISVSIDAPNGVKEVRYFIDDRATPNAVKSDAPYSASLRFPKNTNAGAHTITAKVYDKIGYIGTATIEVRFENGPQDSGTRIDTGLLDVPADATVPVETAMPPP